MGSEPRWLGRMLSIVDSETAWLLVDMGEEYRRIVVFVEDVEWRDASSSLSSSKAPPPSAPICDRMSTNARQPYIVVSLHHHSS